MHDTPVHGTREESVEEARAKLDAAPPSDAPMDFSAWFDVYLRGPGGGRWYTFDARHNRPRIGRILMARGRDATDVALTTTFGTHALPVFRVITDEVPA